MAKLVSKVYGDALFDAAADGKTMDGLYEEAKAILLILEQNPGFLVLLSSPQVGKDEKLSIAAAVFKGRVSEQMMSFLNIVVEKDRQKDLTAILSYFVGRVKEHKKIGAASVTSAAALTEKQKAALEKKLLETTSYVKFEMSYQTDPALLGGMVIRIGDRVVDSSIRTRLYGLKKELSAIQLA